MQPATTSMRYERPCVISICKYEKNLTVSIVLVKEGVPICWSGQD